MNIIIVDTGVNINHKKFIDDDITGYGFSNGELNNDCHDNFGHGTSIYGIIRECADLCNIINIKLSDNDEHIEVDDLIDLLHYININMSADIINLSLGISLCDKYDDLYNICDILYKKGVIIVSAFDNFGSMSYPAAFDNTIGVVSGDNCKSKTDFEYYDDDIINIGGKGNLQKLCWTTPEHLILEGNSYACAHVCVQIVKFMNGGCKGKKDILSMFNKISKFKYKFPAYNKRQRLFSIDKAALFPFNKEIHSLVRYSSLLDFKITDIYDTKYSANINMSTVTILNDDTVQNLYIKNINNINWDDIDTLILGHLDELSGLINKKTLKEQIISQALENNKNIYSFDPVFIQDVPESGKIFFPYIDEADLPPNRLGKLFRVSKPVVGIFGTSSRQGKFTLQLKLRELFLKKGYYIKQLGTEPSALLYGMDCVFPMGYNSSVHIKEYDAIRYLNFQINELSKEKCDIIIVGSQSGTVTFDTGNISQFTVSPYNFLMGTMPDIVILCVNPFDDLDYIERTINFINSGIETEVFALALFPMDIKDSWASMYGSKEKLSDEKYIKIKDILERKFNMNIYKIGDEDDMNKLMLSIIDYFSEI